jgi:hypothetical protein
MPTAAKPLFRPEALRPLLKAFAIPTAAVAARPKLADWAKLLGSKRAEAMKETELLPDFITDVFVRLLGYTGPATGADRYTLKREATVEVNGKFADAALGRYSTAGGQPEYVAALEGKGPRDPLDRPFANRKLSAVDQALRYAVNLVCDWYLVTNLRETRLYHKGHDQFTFERFETTALANDDTAFRRFVFLLGAERIIPGSGRCHLDDLLSESKRIGLELTGDYYRDYADLRRKTFEELCRHNPDVPPAELLAATQKILDRVLFVSFCEDRGLLPAESITQAYHHADPYNPRPVWDNFRGLFRAVNEGNKQLGIERYNGGLFADDALLERLKVPDEVCRGLDRLAAYYYGLPTTGDDVAEGPARLIDVEILGHIFEQSITDLEQLRHAIEGGSAATEAQAAPSKRKREGAFYTPSFITRYIVTATLGPVLNERFDALLKRQREETSAKSRKVLEDPSAYDVATLKPVQKKTLEGFWEAWLADLATLRIVDPACGSGAFLIEAFEQLYAAYRQAQDRLTELRGLTLFDIDKQILQNNLYGVDLNSEAVEICRLSLWIKTAQLGKVLTSLDHNVRVGNSVIADPTVHAQALDWRAAFPEVFAAGGFDVVMGNPPYVRQEWIAPYKLYLEQHYRSYDGTADLYVYFYELGVNLLKPGGRLSFIVTNKWMKAGYGEPLRRFFAEFAWVEAVVDFGHAKQIFEDADVFPSILVARKPTVDVPPATARVCAIPREQLRVEDLSRQIEAEGFAVPRNRLGAGAWTLEPPGVMALMEKIRRVGLPLKEYAGAVPLMGIKTGFNEAFLLDTATKERLVAADPKSADLFRPYLRGQDINRWGPEWSGLWMLALKSSGNHPWPWANAGDRAEAIFAATYPAIHTHLNQYHEVLIKRQDQGEHWWELRACAYWAKFDRPKVMYQDITWEPCFCLDTKGTLSNNTVYFLSTDDRWALAALNSPAAWSFAWRNAQHGKDEALRYFTAFMEGFPVPQPTDELRKQADVLVQRLIDITVEQLAGRRAVLDWLKVEFAVEKPSLNLQDVAALDANTLLAEVKKARGKKKPLSVAQVKALRDEHARSVAPLQALAAEAQEIERRVAELVNAAYGLTPDEVALMWRTAPPRMPGEPPA